MKMQMFTKVTFKHLCFYFTDTFLHFTLIFNIGGAREWIEPVSYDSLLTGR